MNPEKITLGKNHIFLFYLYEMSTIGKSIGTKCISGCLVLGQEKETRIQIDS